MSLKIAALTEGTGMGSVASGQTAGRSAAAGPDAATFPTRCRFCRAHLSIARGFAGVVDCPACRQQSFVSREAA